MLAKTLFHGAARGTMGRQEGLGSRAVLPVWGCVPTGLFTAPGMSQYQPVHAVVQEEAARVKQLPSS